jgi:hypothetical protein
MKKTKIIYWLSTAIISLLMLHSAYAYLTQSSMVTAFQHLGFPGYFRVELAIFKLLGVIALLAPIQARVKEWSYAGFAITFISAAIAHSASGDPLPFPVIPLVFLALLVVSYLSYHRLKDITK